MIVRVLLAIFSTTSTALAASPWVDYSIEIDPVAEQKVLTDLVNARAVIVKHVYELRLIGDRRGTHDIFYEAGAVYCVAASRLAWAKSNFEQSYRYAEMAIVAGERALAGLTSLFEAGAQHPAFGHVVTGGDLAKVQARVAEAKLVLLRYDALAKERHIKIKPLEKADFDKVLRADLNLDDPHE